jgi:hypothetical protein
MVLFRPVLALLFDISADFAKFYTVFAQNECFLDFTLS